MECDNSLRSIKVYLEVTKDAEKEAGEWINYIYSYGEYFGMNELGYQVGELRGYCEEDSIYFIPESMTNTTITGKDGQIKTELFTKSFLNAKYANDFIEIGETKLQLQELSTLDVPEVEENEYVIAVKKYIEDILRQNGKNGSYKMCVGEYEALFMNTVCLSVSLSGEEESYYFRYMIVKTDEENYYFWPVGFGLNGNLEECRADRHYMNQICIDRTKQLGRREDIINIV